MKLRPLHLKDALNEKGESLPGTIVASLISSIILVGVAGVISLVMVQKVEAENQMKVDTSSASIDAEFKSDVINAETVLPVSSSEIRLHVPSNDDTCRMVDWKIADGSLTRTLSVYQEMVVVDGDMECDTSSDKLVDSKVRTLSQNVTDKSSIQYYNAVGRELNPASPISFKESVSAPDPEAGVSEEWDTVDVHLVTFQIEVKSDKIEESHKIQVRNAA